MGACPIQVPLPLPLQARLIWGDITLVHAHRRVCISRVRNNTCSDNRRKAEPVQAC